MLVFVWKMGCFLAMLSRFFGRCCFSIDANMVSFRVNIIENVFDSMNQTEMLLFCSFFLSLALVCLAYPDRESCDLGKPSLWG